MNGELSLQSDILVFAVKPHEPEITAGKTIKIEEIIVTEIKTIEKEGRFARLKKSLRKRSASIL